MQAKWKARETQTGLDVEKRLADPLACRAVIDKLNNGDRRCMISGYEVAARKEAHHLPFSLSSLQLQAGKSFGYEPQQVLDLCQTLYEKKFTTYPRSDCDYLPENQHNAATHIIHNLKLTGNPDLISWANHASIDPKRKSRAWNDIKISAHHAIIPTETACDMDKLNEDEKKIYFLIARAYLSQFLPEYSYDQTTIDITCCGELFTVSGRMDIDLGWKMVYQKEQPCDEEDEDANKQLPKIKEGETVQLLKVISQEAQTKALQRFTPATLLGAMKEIAKYLKDASLKSSLQSVGLGTEATRAGIINDLLKREFLRKEKKKIIPTKKALMLIDNLPERLTWPDATALMEQKLQYLEQGKLSMQEILEEQIADITAFCRQIQEIRFPRDESLVACPVCGKGSLRKRKSARGYFWSCSRYPDCSTTFPDAKGQPDLEPRSQRENPACPICGNGKLIYNKKFLFWGCSAYKNGCKGAFSDDGAGKPMLQTCICGAYLRKFSGKKGEFWSCKTCNKTYDDKNGKPVVQ